MVVNETIKSDRIIFDSCRTDIKRRLYGRNTRVKSGWAQLILKIC